MFEKGKLILAVGIATLSFIIILLVNSLIVVNQQTSTLCEDNEPITISDGSSGRDVVIVPCPSGDIGFGLVILIIILAVLLLIIIAVIIDAK